jgi:hypothetical protein
VDIDEGTEKEILLLDDAIPVKGQKETRERKKSNENPPVEVTSRDGEAATERARIRTDVILWEKKKGGFESITEVIDKEEKEPLLLAAMVKSQGIQEYGDDPKPLNIVAITEGAKAIRWR